MTTEFRKAGLPEELRALLAFDRKAFPPADRFPSAYWKLLESYWLLVEGVKIGCCAFEEHAGFDGPTPGSLYIATTAILPRFQGQGWGNVLKSWEVAYARRRGFKTIVTNTRKSNGAMLALNRKFGFRVMRTIPRYYSDPSEPTVVMQLDLR